MRSQRHRPRKTPAVAGEGPSLLVLITFVRVVSNLASLPRVPRPHQMRLVNAETNTKSTAIGDPPCGNNPFTAFLSARSV